MLKFGFILFFNLLFITNKLMCSYSLKMENCQEILKHWFKQVRQALHHTEKEIRMSQLDTCLSEMVSFQIIKNPDVQLAITATIHALLKKGGRRVCQGH